MKTLHTKYNDYGHRKIRSFSLFQIFILSCLTLVFPSGCKKFLVIPPPANQLVTASALSNNATATSAVTVIYTQMFALTESPSMAWNTGLLGDEFTGYSSAGNNFQEYKNAMVATTKYGPWSEAYNWIYQANAIISGLQTTVGCSPSVKQQLTGEAYFIRAFWHFYQSNCYGDVPVSLTTDYTVTSRLTRSPRIQVLKQVISDLTTAQTLLSNNYVDISDTITTTEKVRPTKAAATALLARAYLYLANYSKDNSQYINAEVQSTAVINNSVYSLSPLTGANEVFTKNSSEAIWQLQTPLPATQATWDGYDFILLGVPGGAASVSISPQLLAAFEPNDQRKVNWINSIVAGGTTYYYPFKYKVQSVASTTSLASIAEYTMVLRLAEQFLIRAEAEVNDGKLSNAIADLNVIRTRAGLPNYAGATDATSLLAAILHERQIELFSEWGHRWFDLQRTGNCNSVMSIVAPAKGTTWNTDGHQQLMPIPITDITANPNLTQNVGY